MALKRAKDVTIFQSIRHYFIDLSFEICGGTRYGSESCLSHPVLNVVTKFACVTSCTSVTFTVNTVDLTAISVLYVCVAQTFNRIGNALIMTCHDDFFDRFVLDTHFSSTTISTDLIKHIDIRHTHKHKHIAFHCWFDGHKYASYTKQYMLESPSSYLLAYSCIPWFNWDTAAAANTFLSLILFLFCAWISIYSRFVFVISSPLY